MKGGAMHRDYILRGEELADGHFIGPESTPTLSTGVPRSDSDGCGALNAAHN